MTVLKNIKSFTTEWKNSLKDKINKQHPPRLGIVQVGDNPASNRYVNNKMKDCNEIGIIPIKLSITDENISLEEFKQELTKLIPTVDGIIVQLPLPPQLKFEEIKKYIPDEKDVDGFKSTSYFYPCTPYGIIKYLDYCDLELTGKNVVIIGRSDIVGKPLAKMMTDRNATVTLCHSYTKNIQQFYDKADIIISAVGKPHFLNCYSIYIPIIDVGINFIDGKLVGDCFNTEGRDVTPVPGGVGLLTRCALLENVIKATYEREV